MSLLIQQLRMLAQTDPARVALQSQQESLSYGELWQQVDVLAKRLALENIKRLALKLDNGLEWARFDLACALAGIVVIPVPTFFSAQQFAWLLENSGADALAGRAADGLNTTPVAGFNGQLHRLQPAHIPALPAGTAKITYTSGTTGQPKGVCLSLDQLERTCAALIERIAQADVSEHLTLLPLSTLLENLTGLYVPLMLGASSRIPSLAEVGFSGSSQLDPQQLARTLLAARPHSLVLVPELLRLLIALAAKMPALTESLRFVAVGGGKVAPELMQQARALGIPAYEGYGLSECASVVALNAPGQDQIGCVGKPLSHLQVTIAADGEILVHGAAMLGYLGEAGTPPEVIATGDLGQFDEHGFLQITGRKKNVQITAFGRNFSPEWIESEAEAFPAIAKLVMFGDALPRNVALVVPRPGCEPQLGEQIAALNTRLPDYARVHRWFTPETPLTVASGLLTPNGRPRRELISQTYQTRIQQLSAGEPA